MITPTRQSPASKSTPSAFPGSRSVFGNGNTKARVLPPAQPVATPTVSTISFVTIQHSQAQAEQGGPVKDKRSLREIREEERLLKGAPGFLKWRSKEERVKREMMAASYTSASLPQTEGGSWRATRALPETMARNAAVAPLILLLLVDLLSKHQYNVIKVVINGYRDFL
ncbi:hypothetical protein K443DRAFT_662464 [Laccaria amethystina LaAM-08-1]|uniref:Uncharacterized protein n=1 Tax=Laccaria amethystina LaAM-08-1 TaxID=1095629 RepID=A0A0C9WLB4_9AGAR|nr:hypothetical protein K443DRAFT_662464 [Laccaria amethystina LaAM-08-1]